MIWLRMLCGSHVILMETQIAALRSKLYHLKDKDVKEFTVLT